jgi:16S rRNA (uracil1498-N3)-methyltransferase
MQRYFINKKIDNNFIIKNDDFHHIKNVMRMHNNDNIEVVYDNCTYLCKITIEKDFVKAKILEEMEEQDNITNITIAQGLPKFDKLDFIIEKATELGVFKIIPLKTIRSVVKYDKEKSIKKVIRWQKIAKEAAEQSKRNSIPIIERVQEIEELIKKEYNLKLLCTVNEDKNNIKHYLQNLRKDAKILVVVGPEGGFTDEEEQLFLNNGFKSVSLGENILRTETAPLFILSAIKYELMR